MKTPEILMASLLVLVLIAMGLLSPSSANAQSAERVQSAVDILTNSSRQPQERISAANDLAAFGKDSEPATQALIRAMSGDPVPGVRTAAALALGASAFPSAAPIQAVIQALANDSSSQVRLAAVKALNILGVDSAAAVEALQNAAQNDPNPVVRQSAQAVYSRLTNNS
jgi:HEAT repeat protein